MRTESRFVIGVDLGTTNTAAAFIDSLAEDQRPGLFEVRQLSAPGEVTAAEALPSCLFIPDKSLFPEGSLALPWNASPSHAVGIFARDKGAPAPARFVFSAKSWLSHQGVNRKARILPWGSDLSESLKVSPVDASRAYLEHLRDAWDHARGAPGSFVRQRIVITIPASFGETARELTLEAAHEAGIKGAALIEEPLAAFYAWLAKNHPDGSPELERNENILVVDVGGGTCDFSVIGFNGTGALCRKAAGDHLLLGGDNIDIAVAKMIEEKWKTHLKPAEWAGLRLQCRKAKEKLLSENAPESSEITLLSQGSSVVGGLKKARLTKKKLLEVTDGFFPVLSHEDAASSTQAAGIRDMGLPYAREPAVTRHLFAFLKHAANVASGTGGHAERGLLYPSKVLFNGGTMIPRELRERILDQLAAWFPGLPRPVELESPGLSSAVAFGAAVYGAAMGGRGVKIKCASSRSYYIEAEDAAAGKKLLCVLPFGADENSVSSAGGKIMVELNRKVSFPLHCSSVRINDKAGDTAPPGPGITPLSRLDGVLKRPGAEEGAVAARLDTCLTEAGVLSVKLTAPETGESWPLRFDTRMIIDSQPGPALTPSAAAPGGPAAGARTVPPEKLAETTALAERIFADGSLREPSPAAALERAAGVPRKEWDIEALRAVADALLKTPCKNLRVAAAESRWLNLCGFCLRPGFGEPGDAARAAKVWEIWPRGPSNPNDTQTAAEWWIFWRRTAAGLSAGCQRTIYHHLAKILFPRGEYAMKCKGGPHVKTEMWRCLASLELISPELKAAAGEALLSRVSSLEPSENWALARLGARRLFHAPVNCAVPRDTAEKWLGKLMEGHKKDSPRECLFAVSRLAAKFGDRAVDIHPELAARAKDWLTQRGAPPDWLAHLDAPSEENAEERSSVFGEALPLGLKLA